MAFAVPLEAPMHFHYADDGSMRSPTRTNPPAAAEDSRGTFIILREVRGRFAMFAEDSKGPFVVLRNVRMVRKAPQKIRNHLLGFAPIL